MFKATISTATGTFEIVVKSESAQYARHDIFTAAQAGLNSGPAITRIKSEITRTNRRILGNFDPIKRCFGNNQQWAWVRKI